MDENVAKAVDSLARKAFAFDAMVAAGRISQALADESLALSDGPIELTDTATIRAHLVELEAEIARLQSSLATHVDRVCELQSRLAAENALLRECDAVARKRGDKYGLCDAIDNTGQPYQSQSLADYLAHLSENTHVQP